MPRLRTLLASLVVATLTVGFAGVAGAARADDQKAADAAVLAPDEVPPSFTGGPVEDTDDDDDESPPECTKAVVKADASVQKSPLARSAYQLDPDTSSGFAIIQSTVAVMANEAKAKKVIKAYAADEDAAEACMQARLVEFLTEPGVETTAQVGSFDPSLDDKGNEKVIRGGDDFLGYGGVVARSAGGPVQSIEFQVILAREGRAVAQLVMLAAARSPEAMPTACSRRSSTGWPRSDARPRSLVTPAPAPS